MASNGEPAPDRTAAGRNLAYYDRMQEGQEDYWRLMAAPRFRVDTFLRWIGRFRPKTLADLGCGGGQLLARIHAVHPSIGLMGVDLSRRQIEENQSRLPFADWHVADLDQPARFPAMWLGRFDAVVAMEIVEHLDHPEVFLSNALALASPDGGRLLLSTQSGPLRQTARRVGHQQHFSSDRMHRLLEATGWKAQSVWNCGFPFHDLSQWIANLSPDWTMHRFGNQQYGWFERSMSRMLRLAFHLNSSRRGSQLFAIARRVS